ncbi:MAG: molecular chaperone DnaJ [Chloroflexi bacterium]|nr:molecular chaperone DnaJ [Chloroflexota bacterium]
MNNKRDYYDILGVGRGAGEDEIRRAYRRLAREYHPDVSTAADAEERFKEINEAYEVLSDTEKRAMYDRFGHAGPQGTGWPGSGDFGGFGDFSSIFEDLFTGFGMGTRSRRARRAPQRGADLRYDLQLEFNEAIFGTEKELEVSRHETCPRCTGRGAEPGTTPIRCPQCNGTGEVRRTQQSILGSFVSVTTCPRCQGEGEIVTTPCSECRGQKRVRTPRTVVIAIPPGVDNDTRIRLAGEGEPGVYGGPAGNLYVVLHVPEHPLFKRRDSDILTEEHINMAQAALGTEIAVETIDGPVEMRIPPGTQSGHVFRLRGKGAPKMRRPDRRGDQYITVRVVVPTKLTPRQRELLSELGQSLGSDKLGTKKGFFDKVLDVIGEALE